MTREELHKLYLTTKQLSLVRGLLLDHLRVLERVTTLEAGDVSRRVEAAKETLGMINLLAPPIDEASLLAPSKRTKPVEGSIE